MMRAVGADRSLLCSALCTFFKDLVIMRYSMRCKGPGPDSLASASPRSWTQGLAGSGHPLLGICASHTCTPGVTTSTLSLVNPLRLPAWPLHKAAVQPCRGSHGPVIARHPAT